MSVVHRSDSETRTDSLLRLRIWGRFLFVLLLLLSPIIALNADVGGKKKAGGQDSKEPLTLRVQPIAQVSGFPDSVACVAFSPDGKQFAAGSYGQVRLIDVETKAEIGKLSDTAGFVKSVAYSPDGRLLVTGGYQQVVVWDVAKREKLRTLKGHRGYVTGITFSIDGQQFATSSDDESVRLWAVDGQEPISVFREFRYPVNGIAFSPTGKVLAIATGDVDRPAKKGEAFLMTPTGELLHRLEGHERTIGVVAFSPDGQLLATGSADETIRLWNVATGELVRTLEGHSRPVNGLAFHPDGQHLISCSGGKAKGGNEVKFWLVSEGKDLGVLPAHGAPIPQLALSTDAKWLATVSLDRSARLWDAAALMKAVGTAGTKSLVASDIFGLTPEQLKKGISGLKPKAEEKPANPEPPQSQPTPQPNEKPAPSDQPERPETPNLPDSASAFPSAFAFAVRANQEAKADTPKMIRVGIIGLDTSHATAFTQILNDPNAKPDVAGCKVVAAYPKGSPDIPSSTSRVPSYTEEVKKHGVEIVDSIEALVSKVDAVLLETNDGRPHLEQIIPVLKAGKPVFIDKPIAGSLTDAVAIFEAAKHYKVPVFSSSSLRYSSGAQAIRRGETVGEVKGCDAYSPCALEATHPDLFWYGIHGVETLFTCMGAGCESVSRVTTPAVDLVAGTWKGNRVGTFRGIRTEAGGGAAGYGGTAFGTKGIAAVGTYEGYRPLLVTIVQFFRDGKAPIAEEETLEIYAFMEAADESKRQGGAPVKLATVLEKAKAQAAEKVRGLTK